MPLRDSDRPTRRRARPFLSPSPSPSPSPAVTERPGRARALRLDPVAVAGLGLADEVALLRAAIRRLAHDKKAAADVKTLAELRHQIDTLCTALKTQHALEGRDEDAASVALARVLEEFGDELGVRR